MHFESVEIKNFKGIKDNILLSRDKFIDRG